MNDSWRGLFKVVEGLQGFKTRFVRFVRGFIFEWLLRAAYVTRL